MYENARLGWTSRMAGKGLFAPQDIKKAYGLFSTLDKKFPRKRPRTAYIKAISTFLNSMTARIAIARLSQTKPALSITPVLPIVTC